MLSGIELWSVAKLHWEECVYPDASAQLFASNNLHCLSSHLQAKWDESSQSYI